MNEWIFFFNAFETAWKYVQTSPGVCSSRSHFYLLSSDYTWFVSVLALMVCQHYVFEHLLNAWIRKKGSTCVLLLRREWCYSEVKIFSCLRETVLVELGSLLLIRWVLLLWPECPVCPVRVRFSKLLLIKSDLENTLWYDHNCWIQPAAVFRRLSDAIEGHRVVLLICIIDIRKTSRWN